MNERKPMKVSSRLAAATAALLLAAIVTGPAVGAATPDKKKPKKITCARMLKPKELQRVLGATVQGPEPEVFGEGDVGCKWFNSADEITLGIQPGSNSGVDFAKQNPGPTGYSNTPVTGVGQEAFINVDSGGHATAIWVKNKRGGFSLELLNFNKDDATRRTQETALATLVAKRLK